MPFRFPIRFEIFGAGPNERLRGSVTMCLLRLDGLRVIHGLECTHTCSAQHAVFDGCSFMASRAHRRRTVGAGAAKKINKIFMTGHQVLDVVCFALGKALEVVERGFGIAREDIVGSGFQAWEIALVEFGFLVGIEQGCGGGGGCQGNDERETHLVDWLDAEEEGRGMVIVQEWLLLSNVCCSGRRWL